MAHNLERLRHAAVDGLVRTANVAPSKRLGIIFLVLNFTHVAQVSAPLVCIVCQAAYSMGILKHTAGTSPVPVAGISLATGGLQQG